MKLVNSCAVFAVLLVALCSAGPMKGQEAASVPTVKVVASQQVIDLVSQWDAEAKGTAAPATTTRPRISWPICFYTSAAQPITSLDGLKPGDVRCWGTELMQHYLDFMDAAGIKNENGTKVGVARVTGVGNRLFAQDFVKRFPGQTPPKLFFTACSFQDRRGDDKKLVLEGAARIEFVPQSQ